jgi:hypothetical protein
VDAKGPRMKIEPASHNDGQQARIAALTDAPRRKLMLACAGAAFALASNTIGFSAARGGFAAAGVAAPAPQAQAVVAPRVESPITGQFTRFALNALLVPLFDDHVRPHWTDAGIHHFCGPTTRVEVNGSPLLPGAGIPATAFTVRWHIDQCWPLGYADFELSGSVELQVFHEDDGLSAIVDARRLRVSTSKGSSHVAAPFTASLSLASTIGALPVLPGP